MTSTRKVTVIPATKNMQTHLPTIATRKRRVAGYARVSTDKDEQFTSYEAQVDYYTQFIKRNAEWEFVNVYTDEGISGTSTKRRDGFNQMIEDAIAGKIDLIITKSVSRFARNTVDSLVTIRKLKESGVECFFEKENIYTFDGKGELLLTIMSSLAQEESRSISENVTWGKRKQFADGKVSFAYNRFLGYDRGENKFDPPVINKEQAKTVKTIYNLFMQGKTPSGIAKELTALGLATPAGRKNWVTSTVLSILTNEKYKGAAILQKTYTSDFLTKTIKINQGEVPQYYVENSHEAIIPPDEWDKVQVELARRKGLGRSYSGNGNFGCRIICGDCGGYYGPKVWNSNSKYRRTIWQCNRKFKGTDKCTTPHLSEQQIKDLFVTAFNKLFDKRKAVLADCELAMQAIVDCSTINEELQALNDELDVVTGLTQRLIDENAKKAMDQEEYTRKYEAFAQRYDALVARMVTLEQERDAKFSRAAQFEGFIDSLRKQRTSLQEFDDRLWQTTVESATVSHDGHIRFRFLDGSEIDA